MAGISLVLYTTLYLCVTGVKADHIRGKSPWKKAKSTCESYGGSLLREYSNLDEDHTKMPLWLDGVATWSPWIINAGCYKYVSNTANIKEHRGLNRGSAISCIRFCQNQFPVGLVENTCYCLKPDFKLEKVPRENCSKECSGNTNNLCGGVDEAFEEYITVYKDSQEIRTLDVPGDGECLAVEIISKQKQYKAKNCTTVLHVLCQNESGHEETENKIDWYGAFNVCKTNFELANDQFIADKVKKKKEFWVGYFRESYSVWKKTDDVKNPIGCYLLDNGQRKITSCSQLNNFICVGGIPSKDDSPVSLTTLSSLSLSTRQPNEQKDENRSLNYAVIIGVSVAGGLVLLLIVIAVIIICKRRRTKHKKGTAKPLNIQQLSEPNNEERAAMLYVEPGPEPKSKPTDTYCEPEQLEQTPKPEQRIDDGEYDHLQLNGQRVSFIVDDDNTYDVSGVDTYGISHLDMAQKPQTTVDDHTYDHTTNVVK